MMHNGVRTILQGAILGLLLMGCGGARPDDRPSVTAGTSAALMGAGREAEGTAPSGSPPASDSGGGAATASTPGTMADAGAPGAVPAAASAVIPAMAPEPAPAERSVSLPLRVELSSEVIGRIVELKTDGISEMVGIAGTGICDGGKSGCDLELSRFAQFGHIDSGMSFHWGVVFNAGTGRLTGRPLSGDSRGKGGYEVTLKGKMHLMVKLKNAEKSMNFFSRDEVVLTGRSKSWPPYGAQLKLTSGEFGFYHPTFVDRRDDPEATPMVVIQSLNATIGDRSASYFTQVPRITKAELLDPTGNAWKRGAIRGVRLEWSGTAPTVKPVVLNGYNVYRSSNPSDPSSWRKIASVPATVTSIEDTEIDGTQEVAYRVAHRIDLPVDYEYEGSFSPIATIRRVQ